MTTSFQLVVIQFIIGPPEILLTLKIMIGTGKL